MLLHNLSWICAKFDLHILPGFWDTLVETEQQRRRQQEEEEENWKVTFWINQVPIMRFKLFLGYMLFVTIRISLTCENLDLVEIESETWKSQMYGNNAAQPVSSLCTKYYRT